jgi:hypothetical protein
MPPFLYLCPNTGFQVQGFAADDDDVLEEGSDAFVVVSCLACGQLHFVNPKTGKAPGQGK